MKRSTVLIPALLAGALLATIGADAAAQKSVIQRSRGSGSSGVSRPSSGGAHAVSRPPSGPSRTASAGSHGTFSRAPTISPGFPLRGRDDARSPAAVGQGRAASERLRPIAPSASTGKKYLGAFDGPRSVRDRHDLDDRRRRRSHRGDGVTFIVHDPLFYDPFFYDPYLRYRHFDRFRYRSGFGCGFYDRFFPGYLTIPRYDPCFSSFSLYLGWPGLFDPWPGFWSYGYYRELDRYRSEYPEGFTEGYSRGYASGRVSGADGSRTAYGEVDLERGGGEDAYGGTLSGSYEGGRALMAQGEYAAALESFDDYLAQAPDDPVGHLSRGMALAALGHYGKAAESFQRGIDAYAQWERPSLDARVLFGSTEELRRVLGELEVYIRNHPDSRDARFTLGVLYLLSGQPEAARSVLGALGAHRYAKYLLEEPA